MSPGTKLVIGVLVIAGTTAYMAYVGAASSFQYYLTTDECLADTTRFTGNRVRVSGVVAPNTLEIREDRMTASFSLMGQDGQLAVICKGPLPNNLDESMEVVVEGRCEAGGKIQAEKVLTRCASKYESQPKAAKNRRPPETVSSQQGQG